MAGSSPIARSRATLSQWVVGPAQNREEWVKFWHDRARVIGGDA
jgi:hypothetical protein